MPLLKVTDLVSDNESDIIYWWIFTCISVLIGTYITFWVIYLFTPYPYLSLITLAIAIISIINVCNLRKSLTCNRNLRIEIELQELLKNELMCGYVNVECACKNKKYEEL